MALVCPYCGQNALDFTHTIELYPDLAYDEVQFQILVCRQCGMRILGAYQESRRGRLDSEVVHHDGFEISFLDLNKVVNMIEECPKPNDHTCNCGTHQKLSMGMDTLERLKENGIVIQRTFHIIYQE